MKNKNYIIVAMVWLFFIVYLVINYSDFNKSVWMAQKAMHTTPTSLDRRPPITLFSFFSLVEYGDTGNGFINQVDARDGFTRFDNCNYSHNLYKHNKEYFDVRLEKFENGGCRVTYSSLKMLEYQYRILYLFLLFLFLTWLIIKNHYAWSVTAILLSYPAYFFVGIYFGILSLHLF